MRVRVRCAWFVVGAMAAALAVSAQEGRPAGGAAEAKPVDVAALQAEVERLRSIMPGQAFAMTQVAYNFSNLWFAVHEQNWPLAQFYLNETRVRLRWALRVTPTRKISSGELVLAPILETLEKGPLMALDATVMSRDVSKFEPAYRAMLDGCYGCHTASEKPFLRLEVPKVPAEPLIDFDAD